MHRFGARLVAGALVVVAMAGEVSAQTAPPPVAVTGGIFGGKRPLDVNRRSQQLWLNVDAAEIYAKDLNAEILNPQQTGFVTSLNGTLGYHVGNSRHFIDTSVNGHTSYASQGIRDMQGASAVVRGSSTLGRRMGVSVDSTASYDPTFLFSAFAPIQPITVETQAPPPDMSPERGVSEQRWFGMGASTLLYRNLTTRQRTEFSYGQSQRRPVTGVGFENASRRGGVRHQWRRWQDVKMQFAYVFDENRQDDDLGRGVPIRSHAAETGFEWRHAVAPNRSFEIGVTGGVTRVEAGLRFDRPAAHFEAPTTALHATLNLTRSWSFSSDARRGITYLDGLNPEPFLTDAATAVVQGNLTRTVRVMAAGGYSHGIARLTHAGDFESITGLLDLRYRRSRRIEIFGAYNFYSHRLTDIVVVQPTFPDHYRENSVRMGLTLRLPMYGTFQE